MVRAGRAVGCSSARATRTGVALVLPTAAAHEGDASFYGVGSKGLEHYAALGVPAEVLPLKTREDAHRDEVVARLDDASSCSSRAGTRRGSPTSLRDTPFWEALTARGRATGCRTPGAARGWRA